MASNAWLAELHDERRRRSDAAEPPAQRRRLSEADDRTPDVPASVAPDVPAQASAGPEIIEIGDTDDDEAVAAPAAPEAPAVEDDAALAARLQREELEFGEARAVTGQAFGGLGLHAYASWKRRALVAAGARVERSGLRVRLGSSGFKHGPRWALYPEGTRERDQHAYYAARMGAVEMNCTYYGMPAEATFRGWNALADRQSDHYDFAFKLNKYFITSKRLCVDDAFRERWDAHMAKFALVGARAVAVLVQMPASFERTDRNLAKLRDLDALCRPRAGAFDPTFAVEFRHPSWFDDGADAVYDLFAASPRLTIVSVHGPGPNTQLVSDRWYPPHNEALRCAAGGKCSYTRVHGTTGCCTGDYGEHHMHPLADRIRAHAAASPGAAAFVGFNNVGGDPPSAIVDAATLAARLNA